MSINRYSFTLVPPIDSTGALGKVRTIFADSLETAAKLLSASGTYEREIERMTVKMNATPEHSQDEAFKAGEDAGWKLHEGFVNRVRTEEPQSTSNGEAPFIKLNIQEIEKANTPAPETLNPVATFDVTTTTERKVVYASSIKTLGDRVEFTSNGKLTALVYTEPGLTIVKREDKVATA